MAVNDFNRIAPFYDSISRMVFGDQLLKAQIHFLDHVTVNDKILIVGGGTGEILKHFHTCGEIHFLEKSKRMIDLAMRHNLKPKVDFINQDFLSYDPNFEYDFIVCPFFLDCFNEMNLARILGKIQSMLKKDGHLLVIDFQQSRSNSTLLRIMHLFFRIFAKLEARKLLDINQMTISAGFSIQKEKISHRNQLFSRLYRNL